MTGEDGVKKERKYGPLSWQIREFYAEPSLEEMRRRTLAEKGIDGPTNAHVIEEIHTPLNIACVTFTTGTSAFQTPVCITYQELDRRVKAGKLALKRAGIKSGDKILITYPPLINVFTKQALIEAGVRAEFLYRSCRDACLAALCENQYQAVIGESRFLKSTLAAASLLGLEKEVGRDMIVIASGTPFDMELLEVMEKNGLGPDRVHDLYGCQEFGWISLDGVLLRTDVSLLEWEGTYHVFAGGLSVGDCFPVCGKKHALNSQGILLSGSLRRSDVEWETILHRTTLNDRETTVRAARSILRLKSKVVRAAEDLKTKDSRSQVFVRPVLGERILDEISYPGSTEMLDDLLEAQVQYQKNGKSDPLWKKW